MKTIPATLQSHLNEQVNTTCLLLRIERNAGAFGTALPVLGVTTLDQDVTYNDGNGAVTYSAASGFVPSNLSASGDMGVDNAEAEILVPAFDLGPVVEADINAGRYDSAPFILYRVNYKDLTTGRHEIIMSGTLGQARVIGGLSAFCELRSISQQFKQTVCEVDSITCRADFGSTACGVDISTLWETGEVSAVGTETDREFSADTALAEGDLVPGIVQWLTGDNAGRSYEIEAHSVDIGGGGGGGGGLIQANTAWNPTYKGPDLTLSGSDLIVTRDGTNNNSWRTVRATNSRSAGKFYFEIDNTTNGSGNGYMSCGLCTSAQPLTAQIGSNTDGWSLQANNTGGAGSYYNGVQTSPFGAVFASAGQNMMVAVDFDAGKIWWGINGTWAGDPAAGTGNTYSFTPNTELFPGASLYGTTQVITGCFKTADFAHSVPSGFTAWGPYEVAGDPDFGNVVSLLHFDGTDGSTTFTDVISRTWTASGNAQIDTAQSKFGGASGLMDGTGDYISTTTDAAFQLSGSDFTIEGWVRFNATGADYGIWDRRASLTARGISIFRLTSDGKIYANCGDTNTAAWEVSLATTASTTSGVWYHIAFVRSGTTYYFFLDGVQQATTTNAVTVADDTSDTIMGAVFGGAASLNGWLDDWRVTKLARYTAGFTPPAAAFPDVGSGDSNFASVSALLHFDGADGSTTFTDVTGKTFTATGNAQIDTAQSKFGGSAGLWDGSGDIVSSTNTSIITLSGDFTVEYWVRQVSAGVSLQCHTHFYDSAGSNNGLNIYRRTSDGMIMVDNGLTGTTAGTIAIALNTWTHIAVVRDSGTIRGYVNGVQALSHAAQSYPATINLSSIGMFKGGLYAFDGHIDDWRVTNGVCRYPAGTTFTVPNAAFQDFATGGGGGGDLATVQLTFPTPFPVVIGDTFKWRPDCGKQFIRDCKTKWSNVLNFRGEPYIPVADEASMATPGANKPGPNSGTPVDNPWTPPA